MIVVMRRAHRQTDYKPVLEDWLFHAALPFVAYAGVAVAALALPRDTVTYILVLRWQKSGRDTPPS